MTGRPPHLEKVAHEPSKCSKRAMPSTHRADSAPDRAPWSPQPRYGPPLRSRYWFTVNLILAQPNFPVLKKIIPCSLQKIPCRNFREFFASYWFVTSFRAVVTHVGANPAIFPVFSRDPQLMPPRPHASVPATPNRQASDGAACAPRTSIALLEFGWMIGRSERI